MVIVFYVIFGLLGLAVSSFLNVCIDRLPREKSIVFPPSHCDACNRRLGVLDLIPVFSYILLRGKCRVCGAHIPIRVVLVECITTAAFIGLYWFYGTSVNYIISLVYFCLLLLIFFIDWEHGLILNILVYPAVIMAVIISIFTPSLTGTDFNLFRAAAGLPHSVFNNLIAGLMGFVLLALIVILSRGGMGWGDVKMAALIGLITGFPFVFLALIISFVLGGLVAVVLLATKIKKRGEAIPFGPYLALGTFITVLFGSHIINWYLGSLLV